ncbi:hypothetical protein [Burkholderia mayonis]|uniref:Uncharacterized protein n=1 Tax=Burkholderia mayonis TaxID=1385591 RepID=A0A1B4G2B9_9BURK|nr:hypothetical protein [Burkholderia mayonis]AOJ10038.1 hypothetical protein WS71_22590 [Burkholderia mayonis]KVE49034.1 hypothetical protein WS71_17255 [Burkholderia mayonis]
MTFTGYVLWSLAPFFQGDTTSRIAWLIQTAAYFCVRAVTGVWAGQWSFFPISFEQFNLIDWALLYFWGVAIDVVLASLVLQIGFVTTLYLNRCAFAVAVRIRRSRRGKVGLS